ncbi:hypothetical protein K435DRAFT_972207 [Dendrothele bispora CBS 962.96]|uniref:Uncharacterized protein n=1 Tax=Dendrothele bispora (strain CBS 962.96) TaxID=1314807 RepID=A0A4S8L0G0_DENBC|nr:hypothetical protein K435DRAFT_972207 [Dendrothele bispora CBS 962.96]
MSSHFPPSFLASMGTPTTMNEGAGMGGSEKKKGKKAKGKKAEAEEELVSPAAKVTSHIEENQVKIKSTTSQSTTLPPSTVIPTSSAQPAPSTTSTPVPAAFKKGGSKLTASIASLATEDTTDGEWTCVSKSKPSKAASATSLATGGGAGTSSLCNFNCR